MKDGFIRVAAATAEQKVASPIFNAKKIIEKIDEAEKLGVKILVFPELSLTCYTASDLFFQDVLLESAQEALELIVKKTEKKDVLVFVGFPFFLDGKLYNTAAAAKNGKLLALIAKKNLPNYQEFSERRWFTPCPEENRTINFINPGVIFGNKIIFSAGKYFKIAAELCEDLWVPDPPSRKAAVNGANIIVNLSASNEIVGKDRYRKLLITSTSARLYTAYVYSSASYYESSSDVIFPSRSIIAEEGKIIASSSFSPPSVIYSEVDCKKLYADRVKCNTYPASSGDFETIEISFKEEETKLSRKWEMYPFVPDDEKEREERISFILQAQSFALRKRLEATLIKKVVIGLSGGLDSTLAFLASLRAFSLSSLERRNIIAISLPCFGTSEETRNNAKDLASVFCVDFREIDISGAVEAHLRDIGEKKKGSVTYENAQARERTQVLMDIANMEGAIVLGTGDLSETALGWATFNGDHMSMYGMNSSIPKTLIKHIVLYEAARYGGEAERVLKKIADTEPSPELLPLKNGKVQQKTEAIIGPYALHDFFLYYLIKNGFSPSKVLRVAKIAFSGVYTDEKIKQTLIIFIKRFFSSQFKRNALPDGVKLGSVSLSPRYDFKMPSDADMDIWLKEVKNE